jgi:CDP-diacylglycerol pyrophosphatase
MFRWLILAVLAVVPAAAEAADPSALWKIVDGQCVPHEEETHNPAPCSAVDLAAGVDKGTAVLKDIVGIAQFLLIPTARIGGIEDPAVLAPGATNYWEAAWQARHFVDERLHTTLPRDDVSLAINSVYGRTQNELHIHIDCIRADVRDALAANLDKTGDHWAPFPVTLAGHDYRAIRIIGDNLDGANPFLVLADNDPQARADMGIHTLVVAGVTFPGGTPGFVLLDDHADLAAGDRASGEQLQDHACAVADAITSGGAPR